MRTYPLDSPRAAARIVALALLADGHLSRSEIDALERSCAMPGLGLDPVELHEVLRHLSEDLIATGAGFRHAGTGALDEAVFASLLAEVQDPALRCQVLALCVAAAHADDHLSEPEAAVLSALACRWGPAASTLD